MSESMNAKTFSHTSRYGTKFSASRCDFRGGVKVSICSDTTFAHLTSDIAEMIGYHACAVHPELHEGFSGYECIEFEVSIYRN